MERNLSEDESDYLSLQNLLEYIVRPVVRGLSFGISHYIAYIAIAPCVGRKFISLFNK